ncbi:electron transfer flavoprotein subunit beta/FixA family protein [Ammoniphilus sp. CFH 90114]|uniref:electron transfer flavoprotein subunit beta/FixA family protein n=1 Tax=Ammoniphilus sp. CFH 90114 TaxID=2493665 RepID=UPI00100ED85B|nr:electron transfer flavoprotein subunit beta/FixA family protein [Ammoniphilus sp. CFH 90114]RXT14650.1 electron transfer flavoprotein subunit beta/FixA family protein [Ammoniphilus sp. CFH 90114]
MNILVVLKQTFDTEEKVQIQNGAIAEDGVEYIINPYDEYAVEEAIKLRDEFGGEVTVITVGPTRAESALRTALAMGADKAVIVDDESLFGDEYTISHVLAAVVKDRAYDVILGGNMSVDNGAGQIGPRLAEVLGIPHVATITKLSIDGSKATIVRDIEGDAETIEVELPVLVTAQQGLNEPRYPSLPGIMKAKKKPMERLGAEDLGLNPEDLKAKTMIIEQYLPPKKQAGRVLSGDLGDQVKELVQLLRNADKVI